MTWRALRAALTARTILSAALAVAIFAALTLVVEPLVKGPLGIDWRFTYRPAALAILRGGDPYDTALSPRAPFFAAPWGLLPLLPVALLPAELGASVVMVGGLAIFALAAVRLGAKPLAMVLFLLSPPVLLSVIYANIEWMPLLGFALPPPIGLFFVTVKPQTGFAVGVFWLFESWREGGLRRVVRTFGPVALAFLVSFALYGAWPLRMGGALVFGEAGNTSLWPLSIPVGVALLATAIRRRRMEWAMGASPFLSPYVLFHAWSGAVAALLRRPVLLAVVVVGLWLIAVALLLAYG